MASIDGHAATPACFVIMPVCALNYIAAVVTLGGIFNDTYFHVFDPEPSFSCCFFHSANFFAFSGSCMKRCVASYNALPSAFF